MPVCVFEDCTSDSRCNPELKFASFVKPSKDRARAQLWVKRVARLDFEIETITRNSYICELHFPRDSNLQYWINPDLTPFPKGQAKMQYLRSERRRSREDTRNEENPEVQVKQNAVMKTYQNTEAKTVDIRHVPVLCGVQVPVTYSESSINVPEPPTSAEKSDPISLPGNDYSHEKRCKKNLKCIFLDPTIEPIVDTSPFQSPQKPPIMKLSPTPVVVTDAKRSKTPICDWIEKNERSARFYTGLYKYQRKSLWNFLGIAKSQLNIIGMDVTSGSLRNLSVRCQFLMTLVILRRDRCFEDIALQFDMKPETISKVFKTWLQFMFMKFKDIKEHQFTKRKDLPRLPAVFKNKLLKNTR